MTELLSLAAFAKTHDVSKQAVAKWKAKGYLVFREGKVHAEASNRVLEHAGVGRFAATSTLAERQPAAALRQPPSATPQPSPQADMAALVGAVLDPAADPDDAHLADFLIHFAQGRFATIHSAEIVKANALAAKRLVEARIAEGAVVDLEEAERALFSQARSARDAWMNFPTQIGPRLAADLGVEPGRVVEALTAYVHAQVEQLGEPQPDFAAAPSSQTSAEQD